MSVFRSRITPLVVAWIAWASLCSSPDAFSQAVPETLDIASLQKLLRSPRIVDLKQACRIIEAYPKQSAPLLPLVLERSNHPELTEISEQMLWITSPEKLQQQLERFPADKHPFIRNRIEQVFRFRDASLTPPASEDPSRPAKQTTPSNVIKPAPAAPKMVAASPRPATPKARMVPNEAAMAAQQQLMKRIGEISVLPVESKLADKDWDLLLETIDQEVFPGDSIRQHNPTMAADFIKKHASTGLAEIRARTLSRNTRYPERLIPAIVADPNFDDETLSCIRLLIKRAKPETDAALIKHLKLNPDSANQLSPSLIQLADRHWQTRDYLLGENIRRLMIRAGKNATGTAQERLIDWHLNNVQKEFTNGKKDHYRTNMTVRSITMGRQLLQELPVEAKPLFIKAAIGFAEKTKLPMAYVGTIDGYKSDLTPASAWLKKLYRGEKDLDQRLYIAKVFYKASGQSSGVISLIQEVINDPNPSNESLRLAVNAVYYAATDCHALVPRLSEIILDPGYPECQVMAIRAFGKMGAAARSAVPALVQLLDQSAKWSTDYEIVKVIPLLDPNPTDVIPALLTMAEDRRERYVKSSVPRTLAISALGQFGPRAATALPRLQKLAESNSGSISLMAQTAIKKIQDIR